MKHVAKKRFGQNFLTDQSIITSLVEAISPQPNDLMVEIGPGLGALTKPLLQKLKLLHVVEVDRDIISWMQQAYAKNNIAIHNSDALKFEFSALGADLRVVGNLPYNISTPILFHLLDNVSAITDMHFMLQKEVVDRITASPNTKEYGRLSVMIQYFCKPTFLFEVPPGSFNPPPKVTSAVFRLEPYAIKPIVAKNEKALARLVGHVFTQRRKTLRNSLKGMLGEDAFEITGIDPMARPETLSLADFVALSDQMVHP